MCMYCIIDGWYEDQRPENIMSLVAAVLTNSETEVYTGDVYVNNSHTEQLEHKEETYISKTANQYNFKENFQGVKLVESEMVSVISTLVTLAENHLTIEEREKTSMRMFITAFNSRKPHMLEEIDARYYKALDYIISSK